MIAIMAPKKGRGRPKGSKPSKPIQVRAPVELADALEKLAERNRRTRNQELIIALEKHLQDEKVAPPKQEGGV